jgi:hypothetical protein
VHTKPEKLCLWLRSSNARYGLTYLLSVALYLNLSFSSYHRMCVIPYCTYLYAPLYLSRFPLPSVAVRSPSGRLCVACAASYGVPAPVSSKVNQWLSERQNKSHGGGGMAAVGPRYQTANCLWGKVISTSMRRRCGSPVR